MSEQSYEERAAALENNAMTWRQWEKIRATDPEFYKSEAAQRVYKQHQQVLGMMFHG